MPVPKGVRIGGRQRGTKNKLTLQREKRAQETAAAAHDAGLTPLDYMLKILRDEEQDQSARFTAAKEAAPYIHPRLAAVEHSGNDEKPLSFNIITGVPVADESEDLNGHANGHSH